MSKMKCLSINHYNQTEKDMNTFISCRVFKSASFMITFSVSVESAVNS